MSATEHVETLADLELVTFRRMGANRVHAALVMPASLLAATTFGHPVTVIDGPVSAFCNRTLRGRKLVIPTDKLDSWRRQGHLCAECRLVAQLALDKSAARATEGET